MMISYESLYFFILELFTSYPFTSCRVNQVCLDMIISASCYIFVFFFRAYFEHLYFLETSETGVAGGAASGKTTVCDLIIEQLCDHRVVLVNQVCLKAFTLFAVSTK